jgi:hypothetical protein
VDAGLFSVFMEITGQGDNRRLVMGPVWDFDIAAGNAYYQGYNWAYGYGPHGIWVGAVNRWYYYLLQWPVFFDAVVVRWNEIRDVEIRQTLERIAYKTQRYQRSFERNFERWPVLGVFVWPNPPAVVEIDTFMGQVDYLLDFLEERIVWLDAYFNR